MVETGFVVAGVSIITIILTKFKFYVKKMVSGLVLVVFLTLN